ncbi:hypothetical protein CZ674_13370 [Agrococcus casei LMG 22410]|uniref:Uncharacterized protein n=1 Tax=Agrococcus casei LMG 22410 TaxID=1255656 RepID=A0A1R4GMV7_9MICO|nr:hypothetical protein CZ674_13370 [Agrococcus casei LMG 22410]
MGPFELQLGLSMFTRMLATRGREKLAYQCSGQHRASILLI